MSGASINEGDIINVVTEGHLTSMGSLIVAGFGGDVIQVTAKAICLEGETRRGKRLKAWFPRKAFVGVKDRGTFGNQAVKTACLARWFNPDGWTAQFINLTTDSSIRSAA